MQRTNSYSGIKIADEIEEENNESLRAKNFLEEATECLAGDTTGNQSNGLRKNSSKHSLLSSSQMSNKSVITNGFWRRNSFHNNGQNPSKFASRID